VISAKIESADFADFAEEKERNNKSSRAKKGQGKIREVLVPPKFLSFSAKSAKSADS